MIIVDAHEDLGYNIMSFGRDYCLAASETRQREVGALALLVNGDTLLGWPDYQRGQVAIVFATLFASPVRYRVGEWDTQSYATPDQAHAIYHGQLDVYRRLVDDHQDKFRQVLAQGDLRSVLSEWEKSSTDQEPGELPPAELPTGKPAPVGLVVLMEGAEGVRSPDELEEWWGMGVRIIGPAWMGTRFCGGTHEPGPLTPEGYALLEGMAELGFGLDLTHMDEEAALQALDVYSGTILASHSNASALHKGSESNRHLSDRLIRGIIERDGVIGVVPFNRFLVPGWSEGDGRDKVTLQHVVAQIDYLCQMAGDAAHTGLGTDFDGGFGVQSVPEGIDTVSDLQKLVPLLAEKGYSETDMAAILGMNWIQQLQRVLPEGI